MSSRESVPLIGKPYQGYCSAVYTPAFVAALGGLICGFDVGAITGIITMPVFQARFFRSDEISYLQGVTTATYLSAAAFGAFMSGYLCDSVGLKRTIIISSLVLELGVLCQVVGIQFVCVIIGRLLTGTATGLMTNTIPIFQTEIAPPAIRGRFVNLFILLTLVGQTTGNFVDVGTSFWTTDWCWRMPLLIQLVGCISFSLLAAFFLPNSSGSFIDREKATISHGKKSTLTALEQTSEPDGDCTIKELFEARNRKRTWIAFFIAVGAPMSGSGTLCYFAPEIFQQAGFGKISISLAASGGTGIVSIIASASSMGCIDRWGRRPLFVYGSLVMALCMVTLGTAFQALNELNNIGVRTVIFVSVYLFCATFYFTWGVASYVYTAELFSTRCRAKGLALTFSLNWITCIFTSFYSPIMLAHSITGLCFFYSTCCLCSLIVCVFLLPETKGSTLEELTHIFDSTKT